MLLVLPTVVQDDFWLSVLIYSGITAIGAIGLNLLTGYCGQISLGHAFFIGAGAYCAALVGGDLGLPLPLWLLASAAVGAVLGGLIGPFALRLRGHYLAIVTLGLIFIGEHLWRNLRDVTGGNNGTSVVAQPTIGPGRPRRDRDRRGELLPQPGLFLAGVGAGGDRRAAGEEPGADPARPGAARGARPRPGRRGHRRARRPVQDRRVHGVQRDRRRWPGALFGSYQQHVSPDDWTLLLSIQYIAIIIVGGLGTIFGSILGAIFVGALPALIDEYSSVIPGVATEAGGDGFISVFALNQAIFGLLIVLFLVFEPRGLAGIWFRVKAYFKAWPFSY